MCSSLPEGGLTQQAELVTVKFAVSPFSLSLIATPLFIKPALPYTIRVSVCTHSQTVCVCVCECMCEKEKEYISLGMCVCVRLVLGGSCVVPECLSDLGTQTPNDLICSIRKPHKPHMRLH